MVLPVPDLPLPVKGLRLGPLLLGGIGPHGSQGLLPQAVNGKVLHQRVQLGLTQVHADVGRQLAQDGPEVGLHLLIPDDREVWV